MVPVQTGSEMVSGNMGMPGPETKWSHVFGKIPDWDWDCGVWSSPDRVPISPGPNFPNTKASRQWSKKLYDCLTKEGFMHCAAKHSIYTQTEGTGTAILAVHVDNMPLAASSPSAMASAKESLRKYFEIMDLGPVKWLLGICIDCHRLSHTITHSQTAYIDTIIACFNLETAFKVKTPMDMNVHLTKQLGPDMDEGCEHMGKIPYLALVGSLMYASMGTCPDITYAVGNLGKYSVNPGKAHWTAVQ